MRRLAPWIVGLLACLPAQGGERIEGRYFPQPHLELDARWAQPVLSGRADPELANRIIAESPFTELRLQVPQRLVGRQVRVHMALPASVQGMQSLAGFDVEWKTQGVFRPGRARPGDRVLLFEGPVNDSLLRDLVAYTFHIDARFLQGPVRFEPSYEIEER